ncbi:acetate/propionate family kinase [Nocardioides sp. J2M5]|uniref:acetate/propionate family kinase n=1 Tax=Nocardioides palaemonis TaxID=2829810 RepID=UPI001BA864A5|nr:acetate/propionate family kinase [Nocardioides palaemonis]MBS2938392.1 acetate/propionate family kinase [Nocardioides palaemonis]
MDADQVLVLNAGSSSLKYQVLAVDATVTVRGQVDRLTQEGDHARALDRVTADLRAAGVDDAHLAGVGHRIVHGGPALTRPARVDADVIAAVEQAVHLAPLHNPPALAALRAATDWLPDVPHVVVVDTGFFADLPPAASTYALDSAVAARAGIRRYGAHGISHQYVAARAAEHLGRDDLRLVTLHLGNGASAAAIDSGRPLDTSMGLTPLEGLVMGTRAGDLDPGILVHLARHEGFGTDDLEDLLHHRSGILGLTGHSDFRDLQAGVDAGDDACRLAWDVCCHRIRRYVGAYHAVLGGADAVVLTAGVGENSHRLRRDALAGLERLGVVIDPARNEADATGTRTISTDDSPVAVLVVPTDEERAIAAATRALLAGGPA